MNRLRSRKSKVFRTDEQGTVIAASDGTNLTWSCSPTDSWRAGEPVGGGEQGGDSQKNKLTDDHGKQEITYVVNKNTKKFHTPECSSVEQIHKENRMDSTEDRETLIGQGYQPCKRCAP